ncbi:hypothetical protein [Inquilinus sp. CAU 1745]|uniref:hypothetical protein n=1 Tax=Inquilinus sp. CAU 1745 TaxID=3140369 RepID=UPI00325B3C76
MTSIGSGYIWPDITIFSDGERTALVAMPTAERPHTPYRYISDVASVIPAHQFETVLDEFFGKVLNRLESEGVHSSNFHDIWRCLEKERSTPELAHRRKLEALLGAEPDEADQHVLERLLVEAEEFTFEAVEEIAANRGHGGRIDGIGQLKEIAEQGGHDVAPRNSVRLRTQSGLRRSGDIPAWKLGAKAAAALREQEHLNGEMISDKSLADMAGTSVDALSDSNRTADLSFAIDGSSERGRMVLRSKWHTGRRFDLARLLGDRILTPRGNRLFPATRSHTYRQKMQRAFAAEFLSPFEAVDEMLADDYSTENQRDVAEHFQVSEMTIQRLLVNHNRLEREELEEDFEVAAG